MGIDLELETSTLRLLLAVGSAAFLLVAGLLVLAQRQKRAFRFVARFGLVALGAVLAASITWVIRNYAIERDRDAARQALVLRAQELTAIALAPGSPLACLDATAGEGVESACEKSLFATPSSVAAATSYAAAEFALLSDMDSYAKRGGTDIDNALAPLRRSLEADRFGFFAHVLAVRDRCTSQDCKALALLRDPSRVRTNLSDRTFDRFVDQYQTAWTQAPEAPVAEAPHADPAATAQLVPPAQHKVLVNIDFPTAASIPPVSIMNPEPERPGAAAASAAAGSQTASPTAPPLQRRFRKPAANEPDQAAAANASAPSNRALVQKDPVWTPQPAAAPPTVPPPQAAAPAAPAANLASGAGAPVQLNPFPAPK